MVSYVSITLRVCVKHTPHNVVRLSNGYSASVITEKNSTDLFSSAYCVELTSVHFHEFDLMDTSEEAV